MACENFWPTLNNIIQWIGVSILIWQLWIGIKQREADSLAKIIESNRQLVTLGLSKPELLAVLRDEKPKDPACQHYYLQLWLNDFSMAHAYIKHSFFRKERRQNLERGIAGFMRMSNMREHWATEGTYYPPSFQKFVNKIVKDVEPPVAAQQSSGI